MCAVNDYGHLRFQALLVNEISHIVDRGENETSIRREKQILDSFMGRLQNRKIKNLFAYEHIVNDLQLLSPCESLAATRDTK